MYDKVTFPLDFLSELFNIRENLRKPCPKCTQTNYKKLISYNIWDDIVMFLRFMIWLLEMMQTLSLLNAAFNTYLSQGHKSFQL